MMSGIELLWIAKYDYDVGWGIHENRHDFLQLYITLSGNGTAYIGNDAYQLTSSTALFIQSNLLHKMNSIKKGTLRMFDIKFFIRDEKLAGLTNHIAPLIPFESSNVIPICETIRDEWKSNNLFRKEICNVKMEELIIQLIRANSPAKSQYSNFRFPSINNPKFSIVTQEIISYIEMNYNKRITLDEISNSLTYNKNYLCSLFRLDTGYTIQDYIYKYRLQKATELICNTSSSLQEISKATGFATVQHFSKKFKAQYGVTPKEVREKEKEGMYGDILAHGKFQFRYHESEKDLHKKT